MFERLVMLDQDDSGDTNEHEDSVNEEKPKPKKVEFTPEQQAEIDHLIGATRTKERAKAQAEFEAKQLKAKEDADKAALVEQGKYKELAESAEKEKIDALARAEKIESEKQELSMQIDFRSAVTDLSLEFASKQAEKDAFVFLDKDKAKDNMKKALELLANDRPYLFVQTEESEPATDARQKGMRPKNETSKEKESELASRFRIRKPR